MIYFDNAATTAISREALKAMLPVLIGPCGNPSSSHSSGRAARQAIENAREQVRKAINAEEANEVYFTSGGTESDNWAIQGAALANKKQGNHIITTAIEHPAVLNTCRFLEKFGFSVTYMPVDNFGFVNPTDIEKAIRPETILISVMTANNEIGTIEPIEEIGAISQRYGILFHTDAVQAVGAIPVDVQRAHVDMLSLSGHKFHGPNGTGVLYVRKGVNIEPLMHGGHQERGFRAGTENASGIVGLGAAIEAATSDEHRAKTDWVRRVRADMWECIRRQFPDATFNGSVFHRLPNNINVTFPGVDSEVLLLRLDLAGIAASSGSACTSGVVESSHVLTAIGLSPELARCTIRLTLGEDIRDDQIDTLLEELITAVKEIKGEQNHA